MTDARVLTQLKPLVVVPVLIGLGKELEIACLYEKDGTACINQKQKVKYTSHPDRIPLFMQTTLLAFKFLKVSLTLKLSCFSAEIMLFLVCTQSIVHARKESGVWRSLKAENLAAAYVNVASKPTNSTASHSDSLSQHLIRVP